MPRTNLYTALPSALRFQALHSACGTLFAVGLYIMRTIKEIQKCAPISTLYASRQSQYLHWINSFRNVATYTMQNVPLVVLSILTRGWNKLEVQPSQAQVGRGAWGNLRLPGGPGQPLITDRVASSISFSAVGWGGLWRLVCGVGV